LRLQKTVRIPSLDEPDFLSDLMSARAVMVRVAPGQPGSGARRRRRLVGVVV